LVVERQVLLIGGAMAELLKLRQVAPAAGATLALFLHLALAQLFQ
jgi:hypothetical protein